MLEKRGPWKGHRKILESQGWEVEYELDCRKRGKRSYMGIKL